MHQPKGEDYLRHIAYDSVVFGFSGEKLKILIIEYHNTGWHALPGGFVKAEENLNEAVRRGLNERTGLDNIFLEQFYTFGDIERYRPEVMQKILKESGKYKPENQWLLERFISVAYYALINYNHVKLVPDSLADSIDWYPVDDLPPLQFDHEKIVEKALQTLRKNLEHKLIGINLLPEHFTMKELQNVCEAILGEKLRRTTFQRKMLSLGILDRHEKRYTGKAHKAPYVYSFKEN